MKKQATLKALPVQSAHVHQLDANGSFILGSNQLRRYVGKSFNAVTEEWDLSTEPVVLPYHPEYIRAFKEQSLLPADQETATLAGVIYNQKENK